MPDLPPLLTFKQVKEKFALINVRLCDPYQDGKHCYFIGTDTSIRPNDFPYASGPRVYVSLRPENEIVPLVTIYNWLHQLGILHEKDLPMFWKIEDHLGEAE